ncbi:MAG TPA: DUF2207 domain-containing protein [Terrimesophilobacter sp.]|nr:DUF2207 domain-containing protein [Terrimesophilobacter sp.]
MIRRKLAAIAVALGVIITLAACDDAPVSRDLDAFQFESFTADYHLSTDADGRSLLTTTEKLIAVFPPYDQNRGIRRQLVTVYDDHPTGLKVISVTDENGVPRNYESETLDDDILELTIRDNDFVHGTQAYVITYTQRDVTRYFDDTGVDEFYWDTNGTGWPQPFGIVTARVHLTDQLANALTGDMAAYSGYAGEQGPATITTDGDTITFTAENLQPRQNLSFAIAFDAGTFTPRDSSFTASPWPTLTLIFATLALVALVLAIIQRRRALRDEPGRPVIVAEYLPPKDGTLVLSSVISGTTSKAATAVLIDLAVAGNIRIVEEGAKGRYRIDYLADRDMDQDQFAVIRALFGPGAQPGSSKRLERHDTAAANRMSKAMTAARAAAVTEGYRKPYPIRSVIGIFVLAAIGTSGSFIFGIIGLEEGYGGPWAAAMIIAPIASFIALAFVAKRPLTAKGSEHRDHLRGLKAYITLAEQDRLNYLQSPQGALRTPVATGDKHELVKLNERLLPYAVLFGLEKKWADELGKYYEELGENPTWYSGATAFNAGVFASGIGGMNSSVSSSFSSSSGGSSGGGGSGGGGGGGGGGGA